MRLVACAACVLLWLVACDDGGQGAGSDQLPQMTGAGAGSSPAAPPATPTQPPAEPMVAMPAAPVAGAGGDGMSDAMASAPDAAADPACTADGDGDGVADCQDGCPLDADKTEPGACGCGALEAAEPGGACPCAPGDDACATPTVDPNACVVQPITPELQREHGQVYTRYASARGVPVLATDSPQDEALRRACMLLLDLGQHPDVHQTMLDEHIGLVVMGVDETSADFPEFAAWRVPDSRARGLGGVPRGLCAEENVMCDRSTDRWRGESICVHEFAHTMHLGVYNLMDDSFDDRVRAAYRAATSAGKYANTYAGSNAVEYFAEGVQDWYNTNLESARPNGVHNEINTRDELREYDPGLYEILAEVLPDEPGYQDCYYYE